MAEETDELRGLSILPADDDNSSIARISKQDNAVVKSTKSSDLEAAPSGEADDEADDEDANDDAEQIRGQIEETRSQMSETINAIQEKLSFSNISEQVKDQVSEQFNSAVESAKDKGYIAINKVVNFMGKANKEFSKSEVGRVTRENPLPLVLIGLGAGLLLYNGLNGKKNVKKHRVFNHDDHDHEHNQNSKSWSGKAALKSAQSKVTDAAGNAYGSVSDAASSAYGVVTDKASNAYSTVSDAAGSAYEGVSSAASNAYGGVSNFAGDAYEKVGDYGTQAREQYDYYIEENPLAVGAVALAIGAAIGLAIPSTRYEGQLMGEAREQLFERAQTAAGDLVERAKQVATEAQKTIGDEVKASVDQIKDSVNEASKSKTV